MCPRGIKYLLMSFSEKVTFGPRIFERKLDVDVMMKLNLFAQKHRPKLVLDDSVTNFSLKLDSEGRRRAPVVPAYFCHINPPLPLLPHRADPRTSTVSRI